MHIQPACCHPRCNNWQVERHHIVRRSFLAGMFDWVEYDGVLIQNVVGVCRTHHHDLTENRSAIRWNQLGFFEWVDNNEYQGRLNPHPNVGGTEQVLSASDVHPDICPACHRPKRRQRSALEPKRPREKWAVHVPKDERENGAEVLDTLLEEARTLMAKAGMPYGDEENARYYILSAVLGLFVQHARDVLS